MNTIYVLVLAMMFGGAPSIGVRGQDGNLSETMTFKTKEACEAQMAKDKADVARDMKVAGADAWDLQCLTTKQLDKLLGKKVEPNPGV